MVVMKSNVVSIDGSETFDSIFQMFKFEGREIRIEDRNGAPWFVARDIGKALEVSNEAIDKAVSKIKQEYKSSIVIRDKKVLIVSEQGLYKILIRSQSPKAEKFQDWITEEVVPSIRETGSYSFKSGTPFEALLSQSSLQFEQSKLLNAAIQEMVKQELKIQDNANRIAALEEHKQKAHER